MGIGQKIKDALSVEPAGQSGHGTAPPGAYPSGPSGDGQGYAPPHGTAMGLGPAGLPASAAGPGDQLHGRRDLDAAPPQSTESRRRDVCWHRQAARERRPPRRGESFPPQAQRLGRRLQRHSRREARVRGPGCSPTGGRRPGPVTTITTTTLPMLLGQGRRQAAKATRRVSRFLTVSVIPTRPPLARPECLLARL